MGFFDKVKEASKKVANNISNGIKVSQIENKKINEAVFRKKEILLGLNLNELKSLAYLMGLRDLEYITTTDSNGNFIKKKVKRDKFFYAENIAKKPYQELVLKLRHIHKSNLADEVQREISFIVKRYDEEKRRVKEGIINKENESQGEKDQILKVYIKTVIEEIMAVRPEKYNREREYQIELLGALKAVLKKDFPKHIVSVTPEYKTKTGKRIDILIQVDQYKIGIETKLNLNSSSAFQKASGQAIEYSNFLDALMIVQKDSLNDDTGTRNLKRLPEIVSIPLEIIANGVQI